jgi:hypothetical protein
MARTKCTHFAPALGCWYNVLNVATKEKILAKVLGPLDKDIDPDIRSAKKCERGEEFFKIWVNGKICKMRNSMNFPECTDENNQYLFIDEKVRVGVDIPKNKLPLIPRVESAVPEVVEEEPVEPVFDGIYIVNQELIDELIAA